MGNWVIGKLGDKGTERLRDGEKRRLSDPNKNLITICYHFVTTLLLFITTYYNIVTI